VDNVMPGQYRANVAALPPDIYVKEIRFDQEDALNKPLMFSGSVSGPIDVVLSPKAGQIQEDLRLRLSVRVWISTSTPAAPLIFALAEELPNQSFPELLAPRL
jgi:hypothetical protein